MNMEDAINRFANELKSVEDFMRSTLASDVPVIPEIVNYVITSGGKRFRPMLLLSSAKMYGYTGKKQYALAAVIEFMHTATLLHDDVIDEAKLRRGKQAANIKWGNAAPVLVGDFLCSESFGIMANNATIPIIKLMAKTISSMAQGEMYQLLMRGNLAVGEENYYKIIERKTAVLISAACAIGAKLGKAPAKDVNALHKFGYHVGMAFQIADDALDYCAKSEVFGKEINKDLSEGKMTLPLIHAIQNASLAEKKFVKTVITKSSATISEVNKIIAMIEKYDSVKYSLGKANEHIEKAKAILPKLPDTKEKEVLLSIANYTVARKK